MGSHVWRRKQNGMYVLKLTPSASITIFFLSPTEAAEVLRQNRRLFEQNVVKSMRGGYVGSVYFERCIK